jgi:hypothetical protein
MSDPQMDQPETRQDRLGRQMGTLWANHTGGKSSSCETALDNNVVRCTIEDAEAKLDSAAYRDDAMAAISSIMGLKVQGFIAKHDAKTGVATETFILERPRRVF